MRISRLDLLAFGPFTDLSLELDQGDYGLHVIQGPNEAGKSSALRALRQFLYGIESRTCDDFLHSYASLRIGAVLRNERNTWHFVRRKGNKDTLRAADDREVVDPCLLEDLLGGIDESAFRSRFGIGHQELVAGGQDIVRGGGSLGGILFAAGAGLAGLNDVQQRLCEEAEQLFKPQGTVPRINKAISEIRKTRQLCKDTMLKPAIWNQHQQALGEAESQHAEISAQILEQAARRQRLDRIRQAVPLVDKRRHVRQRLQGLADAPLLASDFASRRWEAVSGLSAAASAAKSAAQALSDIEAAIADLQICEPLLQRSAAIGRLRDPLGAIRQAATDRPGLSAKRDLLLREAQTLFADLGREGDLDGVAGMELDRAKRQRIKRLASQREGRISGLDTATRQLEKLRREQQEKTRQLESLPGKRDPADLRRALKRVSGEGDLENRRDSLLQQIRQAEQDVETRLAQLGLWCGSGEELERLAVPSRETVERFVAQAGDCQTRADTCRQRRRELEDRVASRTAEVEELCQRQDALTESDLAAIRQQRDEGWQLVLASWQGARPDAAAIAAFIAACGPAQDLAAAYKASVARADDAADRMRREADQVARKAHLLGELQNAQTQYQMAVDENAAADQQLDECQCQWRGLWTPLGIEPLPPREMLVWLNRHGDLLRSLAAIRSLRVEADELQRRVDLRRQELLQALDEAAPAAAAEGTAPPLSELLARCEEIATGLEDVLNQCRQLQRDLEQLELQLPEAQQQAHEADDQLAKWQEQWGEAMGWLELAADATPDDAVDITDTMHDLVARWKEADDLGRRIADIDRHADEFSTCVRELIEELAGDLADSPADTAAESLLDRLAESQRAQARWQELDDRRRHEQSRQRDAAATIEEMNARLAALCCEAGCPAPDQLPQFEQRSSQRREAEQELNAIEDRILDLAAGAPLEDFIAEAEVCQADELPPAINQLDESLQELEQRKEALAAAAVRHRVELERMDGSSSAAAADEQVQCLLAQLGGDAEQYVRLRLASLILQEAIERYRANNQDPVLQRASVLFERLTLGSFGSLREDNDCQGQAILVGVRSDGRSVVTLEGMSDGCRDQLYLALRLASLEHFLTRNSPLPFVVDDVLVQFDDQRSAAALAALAELSDRTQVLFFTHHEHLVDLAQQHVPQDKLFVHRLPGRLATA